MKERFRRMASLMSVYSGSCVLGRMLSKCDGAIIFYGHRVSDDNEGYLKGLRPEWLDQQLSYLTKHFEIISLTRLIECFEQGQPVPQRSAVLTFDDGFRDNLTNGLPILQKYKVPASIFVVTGSLTTGDLPWSQRLGYFFQNTSKTEFQHRWLGNTVISLLGNDRRYMAYQRIKKHFLALSREDREKELMAISTSLEVAVPKGRMLTWDDARELHGAGIEIGAHTYSHPLLAKIKHQEAVWEIKKSKDDLRDFLGIVNPSFCFPVGSWNEELVRAVKNMGFRSVFLPGQKLRINQVNQLNAFSLTRVGLPEAPSVNLEAEIDGPIRHFRKMLHWIR